MKSIALALIATVALALPTFTQDGQAPQRERQPAEERERTMPPPPPPAPPPPAERRPLPTRNVKVDIAISDQTGTGAVTRKVVALVVADGRSSGVRSMTTVPFNRSTNPAVQSLDTRPLQLNIDSTVTVTPDQYVLLELRFSYGSLHRHDDAAGHMFGEITENLSVLLKPGTPVVVSRSADATSDRTVAVEVKAEILK